MTAPRLLIFDMDGVLVDVTQSYRQAVIETVKHFTGAVVSNMEIQALKNRGGSNNDWDLALEMIRERGEPRTREEVVSTFQKISYGENKDGLIRLEQWLANDAACRGWVPAGSSRCSLGACVGRRNIRCAALLRKLPSTR
jgi:HAD superfamily phosphatase